MAIPPSKGIGSRWIFRGPGRSPIPIRTANWRTGIVAAQDVISATAKVRNPTAMLVPNPSSFVKHLIWLAQRLRLLRRTSGVHPIYHMCLRVYGPADPYAQDVPVPVIGAARPASPELRRPD